MPGDVPMLTGVLAAAAVILAHYGVGRWLAKRGLCPPADAVSDPFLGLKHTFGYLRGVPWVLAGLAAVVAVHFALLRIGETCWGITDRPIRTYLVPSNLAEMPEFELTLGERLGRGLGSLSHWGDEIATSLPAAVRPLPFTEPGYLLWCIVLGVGILTLWQRARRENAAFPHRLWLAAILVLGGLVASVEFWREESYSPAAFVAPFGGPVELLVEEAFWAMMRVPMVLVACAPWAIVATALYSAKRKRPIGDLQSLDRGLNCLIAMAGLTLCMALPNWVHGWVPLGSEAAEAWYGREWIAVTWGVLLSVPLMLWPWHILSSGQALLRSLRETLGMTWANRRRLLWFSLRYWVVMVGFLWALPQFVGGLTADPDWAEPMWTTPQYAVALATPLSLLMTMGAYEGLAQQG